MAKMKNYLMDQYYYQSRNMSESKARKKMSKPTPFQAKNNLAMADILGEKPRRVDKKVVKKEAKTIKKQTKAEAKARKSINKTPLPTRSRSGAASGRLGGSTRIGGLSGMGGRGGGGGGLMGNKIR